MAHAFHRESYPKDFGLDRNSSRYILYVIWAAINSASPKRSLEMLLGKRKSGISCLMCFYNDPTNIGQEEENKGRVSRKHKFFILTKSLSLWTDKKNLPTPNDMLLAVGIWRQLLFFRKLLTSPKIPSIPHSSKQLSHLRRLHRFKLFKE